MSEPARPPHAVLLRQPARFDVPALAKVLAAHTGRPVETVLPGLRRNWGILAEPCAAEEASALSQVLTNSGHPAVCAPVSLIEAPSQPVVVTGAELAADGFDLVSARGNVERCRLGWTRLKVISAGALSERSVTTVTEGPTLAEKSVRAGLTLATGLPLMGGKTTKREVVSERRISFIELVFVEPAVRVRILAGEFSYAAALGDKMTYSAELNFRALVCALAARAPAALRGRGARAILAKEPSGALAYESFDDAEREERWLLALAVLGAAVL